MIFINIFCVSQEGLSLIESNQQVYDFEQFLRSKEISDSLNVTQIAAVSKIDGVNIYFCVSLLSPVCVVYVFVCE